jgi:hypothetical protein
VLGGGVPEPAFALASASALAFASASALAFAAAILAFSSSDICVNPGYCPTACDAALIASFTVVHAPDTPPTEVAILSMSITCAS